VACRKDGKYTVALVNTREQKCAFDLKLGGGTFCAGMKVFRYQALERRNYDGQRDTNGFPLPLQTQDVDWSNGTSCPVEMEGASFLLLTNME
jgi:hypothetical protein